MKKGFTLIELLAVIIILAVIVLIATSVVLKVVDNAKESARKSSVAGYADTVRLAVNEKMFENNGSIPTIDNDFLSYLIYQGETVSCNNVINSNNYGVILHECTVGSNSNLYCYLSGKIYNCDDTEYTTIYNNLGDINEERTLYKDNSGASYPELASNMIPIVYDETNNIWLKADLYSEWYDYDKKDWANAVTVTSSTLSTYQNAEAGTTINDSDILTYLVWIPRYKYLIPTGTGPRTMDVVFEDNSISKSSGDAVNTYITHPAFTFGNVEENGFWIGKFEMTGSIDNITIKPGTSSVRSQNVSSFFTAIRNMEGTSNIYSFDSSEVDTHMMKNSEWGAVAYLTMSIYGKDDEVWLNNSSSFLTGCTGSIILDASYAGCKYNYKTTNGVNSSTTGTVYGVYDMNGGASEYVMGNYNNVLGSSGFTSMPESKYYNKYTTSTQTTACSGTICYGHALSETAGWYDDYNYMVNSVNQWFSRDGAYSYSSFAGLFSSSIPKGQASTSTSTRIVISIENG